MARTGGDRRSWGVILALALAAVFQPLACKDGPDDSGDEVAASLQDVLADFGPFVVEPALADALTKARSLQSATEAWAEGERSGGDTATLQGDAQAAWYAGLGAWQVVELLQVGPAASSLTAVAGADLRDEVYSWPTVNACRVDQETVYGNWDEADFFDTQLVNVYGYAALEVLLFAGASNHCPSQVDINDEGSWDALGEDGVARNRAEYAAATAAYLVEVIEDLAATWSAGGGDFSSEIARAGEEGSAYESPESALNAIFDGLFYLELVTKDRKLANPLGLGECTTDCLEQVESPLAGASHTWVAINLAAFRAAFTGGDETGMDDLLRSLGEDDLAEAMLAALDDADLAAASLTMPIDVAAKKAPDKTMALYDAVKVVTDLLKGDLATTLALQIPSEASGDND
jgi:predicted lipoprotein